VVLMSIWALAPAVLLFSPSLFGLIEPGAGLAGYLDNVGWAWLYIGIGGLLFRTVHLFFIKDMMTGLVWMSKIMTDPFHDIMIYWKSPLALLRGELIDPMTHVHGHDDELSGEESDEDEDVAKTLP
jgi:hypothetical protein